jgi:hypothetical protein
MQEYITLEANFPSTKGGWVTVENQIIPDFPNVPGCTSKDFEKTRTNKSRLGCHKIFSKRS